jgi:hypothetical protein
MKNKTFKILPPMTLILFSVVALMYGFENIRKNAPPESTTLAKGTSVTAYQSETEKAETFAQTTKSAAATTGGYMPATVAPETLP